MQMRWLAVLDPIEGLLSRTDTSLAVINRAREKGVEVDTATIEQLYFEGAARVLATARDGGRRTAVLKDYDLIFMRKEPPYDLRFHYTTQLLSLSGTLVLNHPSALRDFNEKLIVLPFVRFMPPTLVASDISIINDFVDRHGRAVIKSLDSFQGRSVQKIEGADTEVVGAFTDGGKRPVMVQKFLESVFDGDKRVITLGERVIGAAIRKPKQGYHANFANSEALKTGLSEREREIMEELGPWMVSRGIHFAGLDFIGGYLTEININFPTGEIERRDAEKDEIVDQFTTLFSQLPRNERPLH